MSSIQTVDRDNAGGGVGSGDSARDGFRVSACTRGGLGTCDMFRGRVASGNETSFCSAGDSVCRGRQKRPGNEEQGSDRSTRQDHDEAAPK